MTAVISAAVRLFLWRTEVIHNFADQIHLCIALQVQQLPTLLLYPEATPGVMRYQGEKSELHPLKQTNKDDAS